MKIRIHTHKKAFSIIEVMIGIFVFTLGLISIYALLASSLNVNSYNKNAVIASYLAREQIEFIKNIRDTNYETLRLWNRVDSTTDIESGKHYKISQNSSYDIQLVEIVPSLTGFPEGRNRLGDMGDMTKQGYRLCLDVENKYVYCPSVIATEKETPFYKYIFVEQAKDSLGVPIEDSLIITSKVIWFQRGYHDYDIKTLITDWRRI